MSERTNVDLYDLLPALYGLEDVERGYPLRALLELIEEQAGIIKGDVDALWDDYFVETCADWVVPYIGDLVANLPLYEVAGRRADVARTIHYRRRKGTLSVLEELARNVTGWGAHAVAFFDSLGWTQNLNHARYQVAPNPDDRDPTAVDRVGTANLRNTETLDRLDGPFDAIAHSVDVRNMGRTRGWHNVNNVGIFLWRLSHFPLAGITPRRAEGPNEHGYHFSSLSNPAPLFTNPQRASNEATLAGEAQVPGPIRPAAFGSTPQDYYGPSLHVVKDGAPIPTTDVVPMDLDDWDQPPAGKVAVDVRLGRLAFRADEKPLPQTLTVSYNYGFSAELGGGPYNRRRPPRAPDRPSRLDTVANPEAFGRKPIGVSSAKIRTIAGALQAWVDDDRPAAVIQIEDNRTYRIKDLTIDLGEAELVIQAENRKRPTLVGRVKVTGANEGARLTLSGLVIEGHVEVEDELGELTIEHCTLVPGRSLDEHGEPRSAEQPSVIFRGAGERLRVVIDRSIVGPLRLPGETAGLDVRDSIVDSPARKGRAEGRSALVSADLPSLNLSAGAPVVNVTIGDEGPYRRVLDLDENQPRPTTVGEVRAPLELAIREASQSPAFRNARVITVPDVERLIVLSGSSDAVIIEDVEDDSEDARGVGREGHLRPEDVGPEHAREVLDRLNASQTARELAAAVELPAERGVGVGISQRILDRRGELGGFTDLQEVRAVPLIGPERFTEIVLTLSGTRALRVPAPDTASELGLDRDSSRRAYALISGELPSLNLSAGAPVVNVTIGDEGPYRRVLDLDENQPRPTTVGEVRAPLELAIREASQSPAFGDTLVGTVQDRLVVVPGEEEAAVSFGAAADDPTTLTELGLDGASAAIAANQGGVRPGPPTTLERTTVFGAVQVRELALASEVIFTSPVTATRRQAGCVRFSYVPPEGSLTPRCYRCQPDQALDQRARELQSQRKTLSSAEKTVIQARLRPSFTSTYYGDPSYAQLDLTTAEELRTGAEDGSEMGVFSYLKQPQREANLRHRLEEYLPFGLEAGLIYVT
jgi:hypothetical protein